MGQGANAMELVEQVLNFLKHVPGLHFETVVIFGSRVRGDAMKHSDLDVILVSSDFEGIPFPDRASRILESYDHWQAPYSLEVFCYTPEEFERKSDQIGMVRDALKYGIVVTGEELCNAVGR